MVYLVGPINMPNRALNSMYPDDLYLIASHWKTWFSHREQSLLPCSLNTANSWAFTTVNEDKPTTLVVCLPLLVPWACINTPDSVDWCLATSVSSKKTGNHRPSPQPVKMSATWTAACIEYSYVVTVVEPRVNPAVTSFAFWSFYRYFLFWYSSYSVLRLFFVFWRARDFEFKTPFFHSKGKNKKMGGTTK